MSGAAVQTPATPSGAVPPADEPQGGVTAYVHQWWTDVRSGDLGAVPIVVGIIVIAIYFQARNSNFLTAGNFVNLIAQMAAVAIIGMGIVFVLLLGEIDLSVGYVSGMGGVVAAVLLVPDGNQTSTVVALVAALAAGLAIGLLQGSFVAYLGVPSFVVTLAGLLGWNGVVLQVIGDKGTIVIQNSVINGLANDYVDHAVALVIAIAGTAGFLAVQLARMLRRRQAGLPNVPYLIVAAKTAVVGVLSIAAVEWADQDRGVPYVGLLMVALVVAWTFVATRTRFGRHVYAVGGNAEAARRAGINVAGIRLAVFGISGAMAALGGIVLASRLNSVDTSTGGGSILLYSIAAAVIGGTSLFGGRGHVRAAVLGAIVIASIDNGLGLLGLASGTKFIITGLVLLAAVTVDSLSRRNLTSSGRA
jgi:D-xylose transport system permease protein